MTMSKESDYVIEVTENNPHNGNKIIKILLSPNTDYVVTWSTEDQSICGWQIINNLNFELDCSVKFKEPYIPQFESDVPLEAISSNKLVVIKSNEHKISDIFSFATMKFILLKLRTDYFNYSNYDTPSYVFNDNGDLAIYMPTTIFSKIHATIFIFYSKDLNELCWMSKKSIDCGIIGEIRACNLTDYRKIFILDICGLLTQWNLDTLLFEKQYQLELDKTWIINKLHKKLYIFNNNSTLLAICLQTSYHLFIAVYFTENAVLLSQCKCEKGEKDRPLFHSNFISSDAGERLLLFFKDIIEIRDPYSLDKVIEEPILSEKFSAKLKNEVNAKKADLYLIKNEKIYSTLDGRLFIQEFSKQQWIEFLRKELGDYNEIRSLHSKTQIANFLKGILDENINKGDSKHIHNEFIDKEIEKLYAGFLVKWEVKRGRDSFILRASIKHDTISEQWDQVGIERNIHPEHLCGGYRFVYKCNLLDNEDLIMITAIGLLVWTIWGKKEIRLRYYKGFPFTSTYLDEKDYENRYLTGDVVNKKSEYKKLEFLCKKPYIEKLLNEILDCGENLLVPDFDALVPYYNELCMNERYPFKELMDDYIENKITLILYGKQLLKSLLKNKNYLMAEKLYKKCMMINLKEESDDFLTNIKLLEIISFSLIDLSQNFPDFLKEFLSHTSFTIPSKNEDLVVGNFFSSHLQNHRTHSQPFEISFINNIFIFLQGINLPSLIRRSFKRADENQSIIMLFPLPKFNSYPSTYNFWKELISPSCSSFTRYEASELYKWWNGEALLNFKWNSYGKYYYAAIWLFFSFFMGSFLIVSTLSNEISVSCQKLLLVATIFLGFLHLTFEIRQLIYSPLAWAIDPWNYFDLGAILFPIFTSIIWLQSFAIPIWAVSISTLLLELKFLLFFRTIDVIGIYFAMIIGIAKSAFSFLVILGFIVFAFAHSLHLLLRPTTKISLDYPNHSDDPNDPWNLVSTYYSVKDGSISENPTLTELPNATTNMFTLLKTAILAVYILLTGDTTYLSNWVLTENLTLIILIVSFSFFTTIYLMNIFIGLLSNSISETNKKELFFLQKAKVYISCQCL
ncbi:transient receptor potential cation channel subfamily a member 1-like [Gigaspora margarita]|uniref:Transient receptor potential cation channel subfamily a member 1-like n=1 Tax=Gigaspora margarita TaxID=4874 RepID=A0A8H4AB45_GIGMA|nr:transient receptor potential cation channel subfamily a member 1-like [Gigaspora margarita]